MNVSYGTLNDDTSATTNKATQIGVTARYKLSDSASLYAGIGNTKNEGASTISSIYAGGGVTATEQNTTTSAYMMGLKYTF
jgi:outer membrane receptor for ferrienterochelin and colicin